MMHRVLSFILMALLASGAWRCPAREIVLRSVPAGVVPQPESLAATVDICGRTSTLRQLEIAAVGRTIPRTFSRNLIGNTDGFTWTVSRHFALKTDMGTAQAGETLALLELALPHLEAIFGQSSAAFADRRMAFVFASSRPALIQAMISDDLHVLRQGGITQEGYWGAYQYAGSPYQNRYIILHELVHLFQYCLAGNTRQFHGFFIEGIADFFSSHVYDPDRMRLTINVLDRAPIHNHLAAGLADWQARGRPAFSALYTGGAATRGLDVLMTAFLQSTPSWEQNWQLYCSRTLRTARPDADPRALSDRLIASLYGDWDTLDQAFAAWMDGRQATFQQRAYGFDQEGDWLVSLPPVNGQEALMELQPAHGPQADTPFVLDFPRQPGSTSPTASNAFVFRFRFPVQPVPVAGTIGLRLGPPGRPLLTAAVVSGQTAVVTLPGQASLILAPDTRRAQTATLRLTATDSQLHVALFEASSTTPGIEKTAPISPTLRDELHQATATLFATHPGLRLAPELWPAAADRQTGSDSNCQRQPRPASSRFSVPDALGPIYRSAWELGQQAPATLLLVRNLLLADAADRGPARLPPSELDDESLWRGMAAAIRDCPAAPEPRQAALRALAGLSLDLTLLPDQALARLAAPGIGTVRGTLHWTLNGRPLRKQPIRGGSRDRWIDRSIPFASAAADGAQHLAARAELTWMGVDLSLESTLVIHPGIPRWDVLGPFPLPAPRLDNVAFAPELGAFRGQQVFAAPDGTQMTWARVVPPPDFPPDADPLIHFTRLFRRQANFAAAYARTTFVSHEPREAWLSLGASDGVQVWANGTCIQTNLQAREWTPGNVRMPLAIQPGTNTLVIKSVHADGLWFLSGRLEDEQGRPLQGLRYE